LAAVVGASLAGATLAGATLAGAADFSAEGWVAGAEQATRERAIARATNKTIAFFISYSSCYFYQRENPEDTIVKLF
jgi:hypothetical protein